MNRYPDPPEFWTDRRNPEEGFRKLALVVKGLLRGRSNNTEEVTLDSGSTSTTVTQDGITADSVIHLMPASANAAGVAYHVTSTLGSFTIHHASGISNADFKYSYYG